MPMGGHACSLPKVYMPLGVLALRLNAHNLPLIATLRTLNTFSLFFAFCVANTCKNRLPKRCAVMRLTVLPTGPAKTLISVWKQIRNSYSGFGDFSEAEVIHSPDCILCLLNRSSVEITHVLFQFSKQMCCDLPQCDFTIVDFAC